MTVSFPILLDCELSIESMILFFYVLTELGYVLKCYVKEKIKCSFENGLVEKRESST